MNRMKAVAVMLLTVTVLVSGCGGAESRQQSAESTDSAVAPVTGYPTTMEGYSGGAADEDAAVRKDAVTGVDPSGTQTMVIRNAGLELRVKDLGPAISRLRAIVAAKQGQITDLTQGGGEGVPLDSPATASGPTYASLTIRVPADKLDSLVEALGELGTVVSQTESSSDVTEQAIDMEARLVNLRAEERRLRSFLERTNKVSELLAVQAELSRVRGDIESMDAQLTYLKRQVARATLTVSLTEPGPIAGTESPWYRMREAFADGVRGAMNVVERLITILVAMIPLAIVFGGAAWLLVSILRRRHRNRSTAMAGSAATDGAGEEE